MEVVKAKMRKALYFQIPENVRAEIEIQDIEPEEYDYSDDEIWQELRKQSTKAYKKLKEREYNLRHNLI